MGQPGQKLVLIFFYQSCMCSEQFHFILAFFSSEAPFGFVQLAPYREGVNVSGNNQNPLRRSDERIPLTRFWLLTFKCQMNFLLKKNPLSTLCQVPSLENELFDSWQMTLTGFPVLRWHQTADIGAVPNPALPKVFMAVGQPFFARQSTLFIDL